jgi:hypothetical protein
MFLSCNHDELINNTLHVPGLAVPVAVELVDPVLVLEVGAPKLKVGATNGVLLPNSNFGKVCAVVLGV